VRGEEIAPGWRFFPACLSSDDQKALLADLREVARQAPLFTPVMPGNGKPFSVRMTNCGPLGWVSDKQGGYRYQANHPVSGESWPQIPQRLLALWRDVAECPALPEAALINFYDEKARMGLHQDRDEQALEAPVVSLSLGDDALFRIGGRTRNAPTRSLRLSSGDVMVFGGQGRLDFHGIDKLYPGTSLLLREGGRINVTLRRVNPI
jgi:alkylated DNA repair protein (DNA oxidative demethylase)